MNKDNDCSLGVCCPVCESTERRVVESKRQVNEIRRRCVCQTCSVRFTTTERLIHRDNTISPEFLFSVLRGLYAIERVISNLRKSLETGLKNYERQ
jgi:transcriptional regulator NrdR family protein